MKSLKVAVLCWLVAVGMASAVVNISWVIGWGAYDPGTTGAALAAWDSADGILSGGGSTLVQLIYSAAGVRHDVDIANPDYLGTGDALWASFTSTQGDGDGTSSTAWNGVVHRYTDAIDQAGSVYMRIFQDTTPGMGEWYYDSGLFAVVAAASTDITQAQDVYLEPNGAPAEGVALNRMIPIPEPSTIMLSILGLGMIMVRRFRK